MKLLFFLVAVSCLVHSVAGYGSGISSTVFSIANYQTENGGFTTQVMDGQPGTLDDTAHALFLSSLFGVKEKINIDAATNFLSTLQNSDGGYSNQPGQTSDLESTWNAILAYRHVGSFHPDTSKLVSFVNSLYDSNAKLYRNAAGSAPDFKSTARALQIFQALELEDKEVVAKKAEISEKLSASVKDNESGHSFFSSITSDNYFGILAASLAGLELEDPEDWISYFRDRQVTTGPKNGGFWSDEYQTEADVADADYAVHAVALLQKSKVTRTQLNLASLNGFLNSLPPALATASHAYSALARTVAFQDGFKVTPTYVVRDNKYKVVGNRIIQGTLFRPNILFRTTYGQAHSGAVASVEIKQGEKVVTQPFTYNAQSQVYETQDYYDTTGQFGELVLTFTLTWTVPGYDEIVFVSTERKSVGFDIAVKAKAVSSVDEYDPHETVAVGTAFSFDVQLGTVAVPKPQLVSGDFDVIFTVVDSSNVAVHTEKLDARKNDKPISFKFDFETPDLPAGRVTFRFQVKTTAGVHTTEEVWYNLRVNMVATDIDFEADQVFNFGQNVKISMNPATLYNDNLEVYDKSSSRRFYADVHSTNGVLLASHPGSFQTSKFVFDFPVTARFDFIGAHVLSFRYQDSFGNDFPLKNFDSEQNELSEEKLSYTVEASLELVDLVDAPEAGSLSYGQEIAFSFAVKDSWTDSFVNRGAGDSTVFLALKHKDAAGNVFTSSKVRAQPERNAAGQTTFNVKWEVDPNAFKGAAQLVLYATDADGVEIPLKSEGEAWAVDVTVDGVLKIDDKAYSHAFDDFDTTFFVAFDLTSQENKLTGAELSAKITFKGQTIAILPVSASPEGSYQVSWTLPTDKAYSGDYVVGIFRQVDLNRVNSATPYETATPFFSVTLSHQGRATSPLPFSTEFLVLLISLVTVVSVSVQKTELEKKL